ncbi:gluconate kinase, SKI family [Sphingobium sp. AP50]|uniref:gluconokinase n=1 Tax=Sphingobium sp. AP50 TaxID=1884369 RepID=UPI0008AE3F8E|nr:gluconokinase [Sphingobium sp. AP50]SEK01522.1 gluconate kinase, SKI family [Sphingobium sp. AP50]
MTRAVVVMGVAGCGKSTLGRALAQRLGWSFVEGDLCHPPENVARMTAGIPLDDEARQPFLRNVATALTASRQGAVASCSALKRGYRDLIRQEVGDVLFALPQLSRTDLEQRMAQRPGHFMPTSLLDSQLATLEPPDADEQALILDGNLPVAEQVSRIEAALRHS